MTVKAELPPPPPPPLLTGAPLPPLLLPWAEVAFEPQVLDEGVIVMVAASVTVNLSRPPLASQESTVTKVAFEVARTARL